MGQWTACILTGCAMGLLSGMLGVGGGIIAVPAMVFFLGMNIHQATGTSLAVIVPVALAGAVQRHVQGDVNLKWALVLAAGGIICGFLGAKLSASVDAVWLKRLFAVVLFVAGALLIRDSFIPEDQPGKAAVPALEATARD